MNKLNSPKAKAVNVTKETIISQIEKIQTPKQLRNIPADSPIKDIAYISPFITISRGKENSRREYHERRSHFYESPTTIHLQKNRTPKAAAAFFENLLCKEEQRLNELCFNWEAYEDSENPPQEACDMIRMAISQKNLLLGKKFTTFKELISEYTCPTSENIVTCMDMHRFWDTIKIQINNLDERFENLDRLKSSSWEEIVSCPLSVENKRPMIVVTTPRGRLYNISNTMFPQSDTITPIRRTPTSILKSGHSPKDRSTGKTKSVKFRESLDKENHIQFSPEATLPPYPRRSSRLAKKLNF